MFPLMPRRAPLVVIAAVCASGANLDPWLKITSTNFVLYTTGGERAGRDLVRHFEQVRSFFLQAFGGRMPEAKPACLIVFRNEKEFEAYRSNEFASAFFQSGIAHDFIVMSGISSENYAVAVHEFTHMMTYEGGHHYPPWFNEGLAELFSNLQPSGNKIKVGQDIPGRMMTLEREKWLPLESLLSVDRTSPYYNEKSKAGIFYAESWKLVHMLFLDPAYRPQLGALDGALEQKDTATALEALYHKSLAEIERDLHGYLRGGTLNVMVFNIQLPTDIDTPKVEAGAGMGARLALAELLSITRGKTDEAIAAYQTLEREYPKRWEVEEGWGQFYWHQRRMDDAASHYERALAVGGQSAQLLLAYGRVLYYSDRVADAIDILAKAAQLYPANGEIHLELGFAYVRHGDYKLGVAELRGVKQIKPSQAFRYFHNLASAEYRLGHTPEAQQLVAKARGYASGAEEQALLDLLDRAFEKRVAAASAGAGTAPAEPPLIKQRPLEERTGAPRGPAAPVLPSVDGTFEHLECGKTARLHVRTNGKVQIFLIADPNSVTIRSGNGAPVDLLCGPQRPPRAVRIEYQVSRAEPGAAGVVRSLEFK